jgi:phage portal protein BeeE
MKLPEMFRRFIKGFNLATSVALRWPWVINEPFTGAWQKEERLDAADTLLRNSAVYASVTGIAGDIGKLRIKLDRNEGGIWKEVTTASPWLPVLRKPNHYQNRIEFIEQWILSKLLQGNAFVLKTRDARGVVSALYVLDPRRVPDRHCPGVGNNS